MKIRLRDVAAFRADRMAKVAVAATPRVLVDLYCLEPGQAQAPHAHAEQDKIYVALEGRVRVRLDGAEHTLEAGEAVVAAAGREHGVTNDSGARAVLLVVVAPPPPHA
ncbi:MAG TPA: cupin domain-containing protein [Candidatus Tectomicrobia bacterium]|nr:cupin domain-containing protein [Candidatus Tectomicrobia bacterium]